jgi:hypothetical protein
MIKFVILFGFRARWTNLPRWMFVSSTPISSGLQSSHTVDSKSLNILMSLSVLRFVLIFLISAVSVCCMLPRLLCFLTCHNDFIDSGQTNRLFAPGTDMDLALLPSCITHAKRYVLRYLHIIWCSCRLTETREGTYHSGSPLVLCGVRVARCLPFCVVLYRSLLVPLLFLFWPLYSLSLFDLRILITSWVSSNFSDTLYIGCFYYEIPVKLIASYLI